MRIVVVLVVAVLASQGAVAQMLINKKKKFSYEEIDFENAIKRYFGKSMTYPVEGIYSVSCVVSKRSKKFLSYSDKVRVMARKDNYAKVAVLKDWPNSHRDFIEVSLNNRNTQTFPIIGELDAVAGGSGYVYTHIEPDGKRFQFSMVDTDGILEAEYSVVIKRKTITYRLSYIKIYPSENGEITALDLSH